MKKWLMNVVIGSLIIITIVVGIGGVLLINMSQLPPIIKSNFTDTVQQTKVSVVHIQCPQWQGSGFVVTPNIIATARHVNKGVINFTITTHDGHKLKADRAISSKDYDISFIYIDDLTCVLEKEAELECNKVKHKVELVPVKLDSIKGCLLGQSIYVIGSPYGKMNFNAVSLGIISGLGRNWDMINPYTGEGYGWSIAFTVDSAGHPGNSGCPVFTMDGKVRGILVGGFSPVLISVMPSDLFIGELKTIELMFIMDKWGREEHIPHTPYYNYHDNNEYYKVIK